MKILVVNKYHYRRGGSESYYFTISEALQKAGHVVIHFAMLDKKNYDCEQSKYFIKNIDYAKDRSFFQGLKDGVKLVYSFNAKSKFKSLIMDEKPDVVHLNLVHRQITFSIVDICKKYDIPVVFTAHDLVCCCPAGSLLTEKRITCRKCYEGHFYNCVKNKCIKNSRAKSFVAYLEAEFYKIHKCYNKLGAIITPSNFFKNEIEKSKITKTPIYHMMNPLPNDTSYDHSDQHKRYFLFLGALSKDKGVYTLLQAFDEANLEGWKLIYAGIGPEMKRMQDYIAAHDLQNVDMMGFVTGEELDVLTKEAYVVVLPSEWYENGPYALMEPMAKGKPCIGANIGGIPELIIPNKTGWLFESGDKQELIELLKNVVDIDAETYKSLSYSSQQFAKAHFYAEKYIIELTKIYKLLGVNS